MSDSEMFAKALSEAWHFESKKANYSEIQLFNALNRTISSLSTHFYIETLHGSKHQVLFNGANTKWSRAIPRCELSDLMIITYKTLPTFICRLTFLQAKLSHFKHNYCKYFPNYQTSSFFDANLEQWDLLSRRPDILGVKPFSPPSHLLSKAILASVGSFGIFYRKSNNAFEFFYSTANNLVPIGSPKSRYAKLKTLPCPNQHNINGYSETILACCMTIFGENLYSCKIGTPLEDVNTISESDKNYRKTVRIWIKNLLIGLMSPDIARPVTKSLINHFEEEITPNNEKQISPQIIVINTDKIKIAG